MQRDIEPNELELLATGAWILGTGGGGSPYLAYLNMRRLYAEGRRVRLIDPKDLADDAMVAVVSGMGAPLVGQERLSDPAMAARPVRMMEEVFGRRFDAVMSVEIGGGNAFQPLLVAAMTGLPVVDADAMGRAFPEAQMTSFAIADLPMYPLTLADIRGNEVIVTRAASWKWMERISRKMCVEVGSTASTCKAPRTGAEVKRCGILHTTTQAIAIGRAVREARRAARRSGCGDPAAVERQAAVPRQGHRRPAPHHRRLPARRAPASRARRFDRGSGFRACLPERIRGRLARRRGGGHDARSDLRARQRVGRGGRHREPALRPAGQRDRAAAPPILLTPKGLEHVGPRAFGYDFDHVSVFADAARETEA